MRINDFISIHNEISLTYILIGTGISPALLLFARMRAMFELCCNYKGVDARILL